MNDVIRTVRKAAGLMRERAMAATDGPWWSHDSEMCWTLHGVFGRLPACGSIPEQVVSKQILKAAKQGTTQAEYWPDAADAAHIVPIVNPAVALAVADWLDVEASLHERMAVADAAVRIATEGEFRVGSLESTLPQAVAVARVYLGVES